MESKQKLIVITGASSGIGKCCAQLFGKNENYKLLLLSRRVEPMKELNLPNSLCLSCDILDYEKFAECVAKAEQEFNLKVDCLINSAAYAELGPSLSYEWDGIVDINIKGLLNSINIVLSQMKERKTGTIIEIGSIAGLIVKSRPTMSIYGASKHAAHAIIENMREELAPFKVRLTFIAPGMTETPIFTLMSKEAQEKVEVQKKEIGGFLPPEKIAEAALFIFQQPQETCIREIVFAPTRQSR